MIASPVTVLGAGGATVTIPFTSAALAGMAQAQLGVVSELVSLGALTQFNWPGGSGTVPGVAQLGGVVVTASSASSLGILPSNDVSLVNTNASVTAVIGGPGTSIVVSGPASEFVYVNQAAGASVLIRSTTTIPIFYEVSMRDR